MPAGPLRKAYLFWLRVFLIDFPYSVAAIHAAKVVPFFILNIIK